MRKVDKITHIMNYIGCYYPEFLRQAGAKLYKHKHLFNSHKENYELVSDIIDSIVCKFEDFRKVNQFYKMVMEDTLKLYIFRSIDINCMSFRAPFLRRKLKIYNFKELNVNIAADSNYGKDGDTIKFEEMSEDKQKTVVKIYEILSFPKAKELFGDHWKYLTGLFLEYIDDPKTTYRSLGIKYGITQTTVNSHIRKVIDKIKEELDENN